MYSIALVSTELSNALDREKDEGEYGRNLDTCDIY
jgi:hypothetical protein